MIYFWNTKKQLYLFLQSIAFSSHCILLDRGRKKNVNVCKQTMRAHFFNYVLYDDLIERL